MSNDRSSSPITVPDSDTRPRRGSIASGLPFTDLFSKQNPSVNQPTNAQANQQRRLSITTLGLSGSPTQASSVGNRGLRRGSLSSSWGSSVVNAEDAVTEDAEGGSPAATPNSPFARRVSFGAQALRDARAGSIGNGRYPSSSSTPGARRTAPSAGTASARSPAASISNSSPDEISNASRRLGEGFNWTEALRSRAERAPSLGGSVSPQVQPGGRHSGNHQRAASIASMEQPVREIPKQPKQNKPDFFQEKILRGDFMD
ncbi:uncharacterized protein N7459_002150 [Penicillium hispanicum]|uniref:uncharacterized protein n=1 Tax=Penicillium hispanicum TaxID=1080232 RepID=UPI0025414898|nr:uncharacterized protein N7459_002150 [Penicillium hispanicum]KAJ5591781.1 hypothetical protein N7459_002150 [Penicillium hispanicum]